MIGSWNRGKTQNGIVAEDDIRRIDHEHQNRDHKRIL